VKKLPAAVVLLVVTVLSGCSAPAEAPAPAPSRMSVQESCTFLNGDNFAPTGSQKEQAGQIAQHYQEVADKVAAEVSAPIQKMADVMKQVAATADGNQTPEQTAQFREQINKIGEYCK
jgi:hypothetical protein